ncbi:hypothetical protein [Janthinobacterium sp. LB2P10]|uniref:hypothetical protein n=1 Tax=Janthinobacterium sp. LB2P10 TaxID=3424194 RepID=UPI003F256190
MLTLTDEIRDYISRTHAYAWALAQADGKKPDEPALVHAFLADSMWPVLQSILRARAAPGSDIIVRGIFTHQTPTVREIGAKRGCELADLMLVRMHVPAGSLDPAYGKALLLQAKHKAGPFTEPLTDEGDSTQLKLYQEWEPFEGVKRLSASPPGAGAGTAWNFRDKDSPPAWPTTAQYLTVLQGQPFELSDTTQPATCAVNATLSHSQISSNKWPGNSVWANGPVPIKADVERGADCPNDFAQTLVDFVKGQCGRPFDNRPVPGSSHWSLFVAEMLRFAGLPDYTFGSKKLTRTQVVNAFCSILPMIAEQQTRDLLATGIPNFSFTNSGISAVWQNSSSGGMAGGPREAGEPGLAVPQGIPILLVLSYGDEPKFD